MINDKLMSFMCSRIPFGLKVFSSEYGILELESVSRDGMVELRGNNESSIYTQFFNVKPILVFTRFLKEAERLTWSIPGAAVLSVRTRVKRPDGSLTFVETKNDLEK